MEDRELLLSVRGLKKSYSVSDGGLLGRKKELHAVDGIDLDLYRGETLGLVGESGCGKTTVGRQIVGIEKPDAGQILYRGRDLTRMSPEELRSIRTQLQMVFQDPYSSLNPRKRVYDILTEPMLAHRLTDRNGARIRAKELLELVGMPENSLRRYPHEFSGGQRQRITIARALSLNPSLIVCDEPVSALDMSIQAQILNLLRQLQKELGVAYLFIAHGLGAVHYVSHRIAVMYLGKIVETGSAEQVFRHPAHPYTRALIASVPLADPRRRERTVPLPEGEIPSAVDLPAGCRFASRCPFAEERCRRDEPVLAPVGESEHLAACFCCGKEGMGC